MFRRSYGLDGLDARVAEYVKMKRGFFVEAGANDGVSQTNTLYFEKHRGWKGLLIEPVPHLFDACARNRPGCMTENCALVPRDYPDDRIAMRYCGLMSAVKGAFKTEKEELEHIRTGREIQNLESYELTVPAKPLSRILSERQVERVDLLSLDVEGYEASALKGIDFDRHRPTFLLIEARYRADVEAVLFPLYRPIASFAAYDVLYELRSG